MNEHIRVLVVLPLYGGSLPVGRYCAEALRELGHSVEVFEAPAFYSAFSALKGLKVTSDRLVYLENSFLQVVSQAILAKVETFEPDLVLCLAQAPLSQNALKRLSRDGVLTAMWFVEDWQVFTYWRAFAPLYDVFAVIQKEPFFQELTGAGVRDFLYLPMAAHPALHHPCVLSPVEARLYGSEVSFMGAGYPNRRLAFRRFSGFEFKIWGTEWDGDAILEQFVQQKGARISPENCVRIYNATKINLNLHSSIHADQLVSGGDFVNPRTFEIAACGGFQLVDRRSLMPELFRLEGSSMELAVFSSMEECMDMIPEWLGKDSERLQIAQRARARVLAEHTYVHRMQTLIDHIRKTRSDWPKSGKEHVLSVGLSPQEQQELVTLIQDLGLPQDVSFADLVWALRNRQGKLSVLETEILFLDEWRKQYAG